MKKDVENEEILIDFETGDEIELEEGEVMNSSLKGKLKDLRQELREAVKEKESNLAGWQRAKADLVNYRKNAESNNERNRLRIKGKFIETILPSLDSFDTAMGDSSWENVDKDWRDGIERIASQLHKSLKSEGLLNFGEVGDTFDPEIHECISVVKTKKKKEDNVISQVLQTGYMINTELVRPAKVVVSQLD